MPGYNKTPNMSDFIANLNMAPPAQDLPEFNIEDDLAIFTNTQFFDFDLGQDANLQPTNFERPTTSSGDELKPLDFDLNGDFTFPEYNPFPSQASGFAEGITPLTHIQTDVAGPYSSAANSPRSGLISPTTGEKRKADSGSDPRSASAFDDDARLAAEEDKRRRNTAASARFRIKKKQREQALEQSAKQMSDKMAALEGRINQLETENKWLKNLITEKNEKKDDIEALYNKFSKEATERISSGLKDGVGTEKD